MFIKGFIVGVISTLIIVGVNVLAQVIKLKHEQLEKEFLEFEYERNKLKNNMRKLFRKDRY